MTVFFHGNFGLSRARMSELAKLAIAEPSLSDRELAKKFGYGAPFAAVYRSWLHKCGISELRKPFRLTTYGEIILIGDPNFQSDVTKWFFHFELTKDPGRAEVWHFFMNEFRNSHPIFTKDELMQRLMMKLMPHDEKHFGPESKMNPVIVRKLLECYSNDDALGTLGLLTKEADDTFRFTDQATLGPWSSPEELEKELTSSR
ncbi:DUF4007 family protein [uncultured Litoreibacter sp.]|uniref:DUF4007 family protein n=1 Tax=uncultured Litoreibacter sp. TaxID=1392394 RepID=UPI002619E68E|nr:DUF4007 family protein [uncultured Litoreibacter sp.]